MVFVLDSIFLKLVLPFLLFLFHLLPNWSGCPLKFHPLDFLYFTRGFPERQSTLFQPPGQLGEGPAVPACSHFLCGVWTVCFCCLSCCDHHLLGLQMFLKCKFLSLLVKKSVSSTLLRFCLLSLCRLSRHCFWPRGPQHLARAFYQVDMWSVLNQWRKDRMNDLLTLLNYYVGNHTNQESFLTFFVP